MGPAYWHLADIPIDALHVRKLTLHQFGASGPAELESAFAAMVAKNVSAVVVLDDATLIANAPTVAKLALQHRLPSSGWPDFALAGGLMA